MNKKIEVELFYRSGNNDKDYFTAIIDDVKLDSLTDNGENYEGFTIEDFGMTIYDIPLIAEYGYDESIDHNYVDIVEVNGKPVYEILEEKKNEN